jgi:DNA-binding SARP family transcriptional activator/Tfp pilus assembly protein PilF
MGFGLLGPLAVADEAGERVVAGVRQRAVLAYLLVRANTPVSCDMLIDAAWDGNRPSGSAPMVRSVVMRLRKALGPGLAARIVAHPPGYLIRVGERELDLLRFEALCQDTAAALRVGGWVQATDTAAGALALWRGAPLLDVPSEVLRGQVVPRLEQLRLQLLEDRAEAELHLGRHERLVPGLRELAAAHPLRERFHAQLMLALYHCGRKGEALAAYQHARRALVGELGIEPGAELRSLHARILAGDREPVSAALPPPADPAPAGVPAAAVPRQLPASPRHFTGRGSELGLLTGLLSPAQQADLPGGTVVIAAIGGTAGVGKTALAVHWAHLHADQFPDGQLYVNLRGFDPSGTPMAPAEAIRRFLDALGVPAQRIPADLDEQAALYRSQLAGRRILVLLDNARDVEQLRPLLPGAPGCLVLVTSRDQLAELVALDGAISLTLHVLTDGEARDLLAHRLGSERLAVEEEAVDELITLCARLPLALNIAAAHATLHPVRSLPVLVNELRDAHQRLDTLAIGSGALGVRVVFSWSYRTLGPEAARVFRLLGTHPGPDISLQATASLTALDPEHTRHALHELIRAHLLTEHAPGRYTFHDLLRAYATDLARSHDGQSKRHDALRQVCDFYLHTAYAAARLLRPERPPIRLAPPAPGTRPSPLADVPAALAWFDAEHTNLLAAQRAAAVHHRHLAVWQLAWTLDTFHFRRGRRYDQLAAWQAALDAANHLGPASIARAQRGIGRAYIDLGRCDEAIGCLHQALAVADDLTDPADQASTHHMLSWAWERRGDDRQALHHATRALDLFRAAGQPAPEARALNAVGWYTARLGEYCAARRHCEAALALHRRDQNVEGEAETLDSLGYLEHHTGRHRQAIDRYQQALALRRGQGNTYASANTLDNLARPYTALGQHEQARAVWRQALGLYQQQGRTQDAERVQHQLDSLNRSGSG